MRTNQLCSCILAQSVCVIHPTEIFTDSLRLMSRALEAAEHTVRLGGTETEAFDGAAPHGCSRGRGNREADAHRGGARLVECRGRVMTNTGEIRSEFSVRIPFEEFVKQPAWQSLPAHPRLRCCMHGAAPNRRNSNRNSLRSLRASTSTEEHYPA
jgi:hypothetical protein